MAGPGPVPEHRWEQGRPALTDSGSAGLLVLTGVRKASLERDGASSPVQKPCLWSGCLDDSSNDRRHRLLIFTVLSEAALILTKSGTMTARAMSSFQSPRRRVTGHYTCKHRVHFLCRGLLAFCGEKTQSLSVFSAPTSWRPYQGAAAGAPRLAEGRGGVVRGSRSPALGPGVTEGSALGLPLLCIHPRHSKGKEASQEGARETKWQSKASHCFLRLSLHYLFLIGKEKRAGKIHHKTRCRDERKPEAQ